MDDLLRRIEGILEADLPPQIALGAISEACKAEREAPMMSRPRAAAVSASQPKYGSWIPDFLEELANHGVVSKAARRAGISVTSALAMRKRNKTFSRAWEEALESSIIALEDEARMRAMAKWKPSDPLLMFLLKHVKPETYGDEHKVTVGGSDKPIEVRVTAVADYRNAVAMLAPPSDAEEGAFREVDEAESELVRAS